MENGSKPLSLDDINDKELFQKYLDESGKNDSKQLFMDQIDFKEVGLQCIDGSGGNETLSLEEMDDKELVQQYIAESGIDLDTDESTERCGIVKDMVMQTSCGDEQKKDVKIDFYEHPLGSLKNEVDEIGNFSGEGVDRDVKTEIQGHHLELLNSEQTNNSCNFLTSSQRTDIKSFNTTVHLKERKFKCDHCEYTALEGWKLRTHITSIHLDKRTFKCDKCKFKAPQLLKLNNHISSVHLKEKNFKCDFCEYTSSYRADVRTHIKGVHLKERRFKCDHCEHLSFSRAHLKRHIKNVHLN